MTYGWWKNRAMAGGATLFILTAPSTVPMMNILHLSPPAAVHLTDSVSTAAYELDCLIAPDESFLLMGAYGGKDGYGNYDIYISRRVDGKWTPSRNLGPKVNSAFRDYSPRISPGGRYLFFTSEKDFSSGKKKITSYKELEKGLTAS